MFGRVAVRSIAGFLLFLLAAFANPVAACAQWQVNVAATDPARLPSPAPATVEPFGRNAVPVTFGGILTKWSGVEADIRAESDILAHCRDGAEFCPVAAQKFLAVVAEGRAHAGRARIGLVNRAINMAIRPMSDLAQWGVPDRWSAPLATLTSGRGDCEDYAIAKYIALTLAGVAAGDVRLVIVHDLAVGEDHAVVAARLDGGWIVLDNRRLALLADSQMGRVVPLFVLDGDGVRQFTPTVMAQTRATASTAAPGALGF